jgi:hypothetical protein
MVQKIATKKHQSTKDLAKSFVLLCGLNDDLLAVIAGRSPCLITHAELNSLFIACNLPLPFLLNHLA